jgi:hypothetical protein
MLPVLKYKMGRFPKKIAVALLLNFAVSSIAQGLIFKYYGNTFRVIIDTSDMI